MSLPFAFIFPRRKKSFIDKLKSKKPEYQALGKNQLFYMYLKGIFIINVVRSNDRNKCRCQRLKEKRSLLSTVLADDVYYRNR